MLGRVIGCTDDSSRGDSLKMRSSTTLRYVTLPEPRSKVSQSQYDQEALEWLLVLNLVPNVKGQDKAPVRRFPGG